jgi:flagellum-specific peptidoglycan hydrolase FlgJ
MTTPQKDFLQQANTAALRSGHIFPEMAACEAALESAYGTSQLAREANNLLGMKQHRHMIYQTMNLPTREFQDSAWIQTTAAWIVYPDWASCFADRMATLQRLASVYPHYKHALDAGSATTYINEVSQTWSTDPERANKVLAIYDHIAGDWSAVQN